MPYSIRTRDGITLNNIPDDVAKDDPRLKEMVRVKRNQIQKGERATRRENLKTANPGEYDPESQQYHDRYGPNVGASYMQKAKANLGAGFENFGIGAAQLALPKAAERGLGITDEALTDRRLRNEDLAADTTGGAFLQVAGEALPMFAIPGGKVAQGLGAVPKMGPALQGMGVGTRAMPTLIAEGAGLGALSGAITPTQSGESAGLNTALGAAGGAMLPAALAGGKALVSPFVPKLRQEKVAKLLGESVDTSPAAQQQLQRAAQASARSVVPGPQSTAALAQSDELARLEQVARADGDTGASWTSFDEAANNGRWQALDSALGNQASVDAAKASTDSYIANAMPAVMRQMRKTPLANGIEDLLTAAKGKLDHAEANRNNWSAVIYKKLREEIKASNRSAQSLWNVRKMLREWQEGTPPPGFEGTRAPKGDRAIQETIGAIDEVLNRASGGSWSRFMTNIGDYYKKETAQKAGQNIRNALVGETTGSSTGPLTKTGNPVVTRAKLARLLETHGKNEFGETLDWAQRNVVDQVLSHQRAGEILDRVRASASRGGSQTAPLLSLMKSKGSQLTSGWFAPLANWFSNIGRSKQQQIINQILQEPADALLIMRTAEKLKRPLSNAEKRLVYAARALLNAPAQAGVGAATALQQPADEVGQ